MGGNGAPGTGMHWNQWAVIRINSGLEPEPATPLS